MEHDDRKSNSIKISTGSEYECKICQKIIVKNFGNDAEQSIYDQGLREAIAACNDCSELSEIFRRTQMDTENLELVYCRIQTCLQGELNKIGSFQIFPFGSILSGLLLRNIDIYIEETGENPDKRSRTVYYKKLFIESNVYIRRLSTGFSLDINNTGCNSVANSKFLRALNQWDKRIYKLMLFLKIWSNNLKMRSNSMT